MTQGKKWAGSWLNIPGILWIDVPKGTDRDCTDKVELDGKLDLYRKQDKNRGQ